MLVQWVSSKRTSWQLGRTWSLVDARSILKGLLERRVEQRLASGSMGGLDLMEHPYFKVRARGMYSRIPEKKRERSTEGERAQRDTLGIVRTRTCEVL